MHVFQVALGAAQLINVSGEYQRGHWTRVIKDTGQFFNPATGIYRPPAGTVIFGGQVWAQSGLCGPHPQLAAKLWKNGQIIEIGAGLGNGIGAYPGSSVCPLPMCVDVASGTDEYHLWIYGLFNTAIPDPDPAKAGQFLPNSLVINDHPAHTWWSATWHGL